ncbi:MAG: SCO family protein [Anaerolineae bacterium]
MRRQILISILILLLSLLLLPGCGLFQSEYEFKGTLIDPPLPVDNFELTAANNQPYQLSDAGEDIVLVFFGYTFCPDVCPLTLADVKKALANFDQRDRVTVLFISVDPERDTPDVVNQYATSFDPEFIGLTSDDYANIQVAMEPFGAFAEKEPVANSAAGYLVNHTARLYLVMPDGGLKLTYPFGFSAEDLRSDLEHLLSSTG